MHPLTALDIAEIHHLVARYGLTTDNADADGFMQTWVAPADFGGYDSGAFGRYDRSLVVKTEQGWRFKRRTLHVDAGFFKSRPAQA